MRSPRASRFPAYAGAVLALAGAAVVTEVSSAHEAAADGTLGWLTGPHPALFGIFAVCLFVTEIQPANWLRFANTEVSLSWVFALSLLLCDAPIGAVLTLAVSAAISNRLAGMDLVRNAFNTSQMLVSLVAGSRVLDLLSGGQGAITESSVLGGRWLFAVTAAGLTIYGCNALLVAGAVTIARGEELIPTFVDGIRTNLAGDGLLLALAPIAVQSGLRSTWLLVPLVATGLGTYRVARHAGHREYEATHDELTGLANRRHFNEQIALVCGRSGELRNAVVIVDLDRFKAINDTYGHATGDVVLAEQARRLREVLPAGSTIARLGGDEFAAVCSVASVAEARLLADAVTRHLAEPIDVSGRLLEVGASVGVALGSPSGVDASDQMLAAADRAMYESKGSAHRFTVFELPAAAVGSR